MEEDQHVFINLPNPNKWKREDSYSRVPEPTRKDKMRCPNCGKLFKLKMVEDDWHSYNHYYLPKHKTVKYVSVKKEKRKRKRGNVYSR